MSDDARTLHVQITLELPEADARELLAEIQDHATRDVTDGHRDSGLIMLPSEAIVMVELVPLGLDLLEGVEAVERWSRG